MENNHKYFINRNCKYFPCHKILDDNDFNCMFCFCPLYSFGSECGGNFKFSGEKKIKNCIDCILPHKPEYYSIIMEKLKERNKLNHG